MTFVSGEDPGAEPSGEQRTALGRAIAYCATRHTLTNLLFGCVVFGGVFAWTQTSKEELPAITFDFVRVSVSYPGAPAADVEYFVTRPIEEEIRALDGIHRISSTSSVGQSNVSVELEPGLSSVDQTVTEIRNAVLDVPLPRDVVDDPEVRVFKTAKKAILDIGMIHTGAEILDVGTRRELQSVAFALESRLVAMPEIHSVDRRGWLPEEIHVRARPERLRKFEIPLNRLMDEIRTNHVRQPAGTIEAEGEPKVTLLSELDTPERLSGLVVQGGFEGRVVRLGEVAEVVAGFEKNDTVLKVNGHEAVMFSVVKSPTSGILEALDAVHRVVETFEKANIQGTPVRLVLLDDESIDLRNRLSLVSVNGAIGFALVLCALFLFLSKRSGFWVAMGIPFTLGFTMIFAWALDYTVNGISLAAVIIVMGMIVDDAIVVAENVDRQLLRGVPRSKAVVDGTAYVFLPIIASITTTCLAFLPLFFFSGRFGAFGAFIPPMIFLMLGASLIESLFILPGHLNLGRGGAVAAAPRRHWFERVEALYGGLLERLLRFKWLVMAALGGLFALSGWILVTKMSFVMFPNEETRDLVLTGFTPPSHTRYETARKVRELEDAVIPYLGREVVGFRTEIARSRRGGAVEENQFRMTIEIVPPGQRAKSADDLIAELEAAIAAFDGYTRLAFRKTRWGQESGSPVEILVQQNDDAARDAIVRDVQEALRARGDLHNVEVDEALLVPEFRIDVDREKLKRLSISAADVASTLRAALEGTVLYEFPHGDEEIRVRATIVDAAKDDIGKVLAIPVENLRNYLVPVGDLVRVERVSSPSSIAREDLKRTSRVYADIDPESESTPLEVADALEAEVFPGILSRHPTTTLSFTGEIRDTREAGQDFRNAALLALVLIYVVLAILFDSFWKPFFIMVAIPFGVIGVVLAFYLHGKLLFGFFAAIGLLGLSGVVINDSIIMLVKLDDEIDRSAPRSAVPRAIAEIARTRLRAVLLTTVTTVAGLVPTAYGFAGYDAMLAEMMLAMAWGLAFGTVITLVLVPCLYAVGQDLRFLGGGLRRMAGPRGAAAALILSIIAASPAAAEDTAQKAPEAEVLELSEFVERAVRNDTEFEEILVDHLRLAYQRDLALPPRDLVVSVREELELALDGGPESVTTVALDKLFPMSGTSVGASYQLVPGSGGRSDFSRFTASISQPIAENAFGRSTELLDRIVGLEVDVARHQIAEAYEDYMALVMGFYVDWYEAWENLEVGKSSFRENRRLLESMHSRRRSQIALPVDVDKVEIQVLEKEERLVELEERYRNRRNLVERVIGREGNGEIVPARPALAASLPETFAGAFEAFEERGRTLSIFRLLEGQSRLRVDRDADALLPSIDLLLTFRREGDDAEIRNAENEILAGVGVAWPLRDQVAEASLGVSRVALGQARLATRNARRRLETDLRNLHLEIGRERRLAELADEKVALAASILEAEAENYSFAKITLNDYIQAVNVLDSTRFAQIRRQVTWRKLVLEWLRLTDQLVATFDVRRRAAALSPKPTSSGAAELR